MAFLFQNFAPLACSPPKRFDAVHRGACEQELRSHRNDANRDIIVVYTAVGPAWKGLL